MTFDNGNFWLKSNGDNGNFECQRRCVSEAASEWMVGDLGYCDTLIKDQILANAQELMLFACIFLTYVTF